MARVLGIDPGVRGGIALIVLNGSGEATPVQLWDMPVTTGWFTGERKIVDGQRLAEIVRIAKPDMIGIEIVGPRPGEGVLASFTFGFAVGVIDTIVRAVKQKAPIHFIGPQAWQKRLGLPVGGDKDRRRIAAELIPLLEGSLSLKKDMHKADAALVALAVGRMHVTKEVKAA